MMKVLVLDGVKREGLVELEDEPGIILDVRPTMTEEELERVIGDCHALIVRSATKVTASVLKKAEHLKVVGRAGAGLDNIDTKAAEAKGIAVVNAPGGNTVAAVEHTTAMILALMRNIPQADACLREGEWNRKDYVGTELCGKTLGIIGLGRIGSGVSRRMQGYEMKILGYDPYLPRDEEEAAGVERVSLEDLLKRSDVITVHTPKTQDTKHLIGEEEFALMKDGVRIINCARGGIVDEGALYKALKSQKVAGAAIDVFEREPETDSPLMELENVVITPHLGASTHEAQFKVARDISRKVKAVLQKREVRDPVQVS